MEKKSKITTALQTKFFLVMLIVFMSNVSYAQIHKNSKIDSLKNEVLSRLNNNNLTFWFAADSGPDQTSLHPQKVIDKILLENNQLIFKTEKEIKSVDFLLNNLRINEDMYGEPKSKNIMIGGLIMINKNAKSNSGTKKYRTEVEMNNEEIIQLYNSLCLLQNDSKIEFYTNDLISFKAIANAYHSQNEKPVISEEQRKYIVQANLMNQNKAYLNAIELYLKAIEIDPTAYPSAYSNLALLSAQMVNYNGAIFYMKKYLLLKPDAADARTAQDKIYEWELMIQK